MKKRIDLFNRYYKNVYLEKIDNVDGCYQLHGPDESFQYMRIGFNNDENGKPDYLDINFIDPDGGPFLQVGNKIDEDKVITDIEGMMIENKCVYFIDIKKEDQK